MSVVIRVENLSKQYRLGEYGTGTVSHDLNRWWHKIRGKEDPYLKIGDVNDRTVKGTSDYAWALKDINFEVNQGEVLGIIGKNGAGKSTLLKLLSRVTSPTTGSIKAKGRIASLLEVGTGFHDDLTGRENVFLNGAILGMTKVEIRSKFDEIVAFSGTERYIDTPVKRYSSGMRVRLAFAVAAHLDPEILIVDEVLAVGDADFQNKAIGKLQDVSKGQGRTVLFVSHNMSSIKRLCTTGLYLENGYLVLQDNIKNVADLYSQKSLIVNKTKETVLSSCGRFRLKTPYWVDHFGLETEAYSVNDKKVLRFEFDFDCEVPKINPGFAILDLLDQRLFTSHLLDDENSNFTHSLKGRVVVDSIVDLPLAPGVYKVIYGVRDEFDNTVLFKEDLLLEVQQTVAKNGASGLLWYTTKWKINSNLPL
ncbi:ABC transporter ATP-binding protein [Pontibacter sp. H259]|uniref:ABC transporter ATP-binding protein n=1 Tax=Pontibacter sp. H259 TaxID=3133421 RepID=UPI0030C27CE6